MDPERIAVAQINTTVGDFEGNAETILDRVRTARQRGAELVCFPELAVCGYPPRDLLARPSFLQESEETLRTLAGEVEDVDVLVGYAGRSREGVGKSARNAAALLRDGSIEATYFKQLLPTYDVFDEARHFEPGKRSVSLNTDPPGAVTICEDIWNDPEFTGRYGQPRYDHNPLEDLEDEGIGLLVNLSASPYVRGKERFRAEMLQRLAEKYGTTIVMCNLVGGNDSLIFDGHSLVVSPTGEILAQGASFEEDLMLVDLSARARRAQPEFMDTTAAVYEALTLGLSDYMAKCGFGSAVVGLSGGIDSSLTGTLAADALGSENVLGVMMPTEISSEASVTDAEALAGNLGIETRRFEVQGTFEAYLDLFEEEFAGLEWDHTEENLQARIRGNILMALSNKYGHMLISTGNKSELAVGYCTLYGDMSGGLAVISDVPKTLVYKLSRYRNEVGESVVIPPDVLEKPPSAELSPGQLDQDELPPYEVLDDIIERYVNRRESPRRIVEAGYDRAVVEDVVRRIDRNEYKRQQAPIGLKITTKAFASGWRMPVAQRFDAP